MIVKVYARVEETDRFIALLYAHFKEFLAMAHRGKSHSINKLADLQSVLAQGRNVFRVDYLVSVKILIAFGHTGRCYLLVVSFQNNEFIIS